MSLYVELLFHTPEPEKTIASAAKLCYSQIGAHELMENMDGGKASEFLDMLMSYGHESALEHVSFSFAIEGVSRSLMAQITRHRIASFSVQSQRYVNKNAFLYIVPPEIEEIPEAKKEFVESMEAAQTSYIKLTEILTKKHMRDFAENRESEVSAKKKAEKAAQEDARFVLPNACETKIFMTMNARSLYNFFKLRCCNRAQWEIRALAIEMLRLVKRVAPTLFKNCGPSCLHGACSEGNMSCGKMREVRKCFSELE